MKANKFYLAVLLALFSITAIVGCRKKQETLVKIHVRDDANQSVANARVILYGQPSPDVQQGSNPILYDTTYTNSAGEALFNFDDVYQLGQAGVAVLNIDVQNGALTGQGIIKVVEETTSEETVIIN